MSVEYVFRQVNISNIKMIFIVATLILLIALLQKLKPTFSVTYHINNKPSYVKAKFISKLLTSATLYICGFYLYYFTNLTETSKYSAFALWIPIMLYHAYKWGFTKLFENAIREE
ncbi:hypothetical protein JCM15765_30780 [Paradesulfitobacterium aromaticivorans]